MKLKPCPFCGGKAEYIVVKDMDYLEPNDYLVFCPKCKIGTDSYSSRKEAKEVWNRRVKQ